MNTPTLLTPMSPQHISPPRSNSAPSLTATRAKSPTPPRSPSPPPDDVEAVGKEASKDDGKDGEATDDDPTPK